MTQRMLCEQAGVSRAMLSAWENNHREPRASSLGRLARILGDEVWEFWRSTE